MIVKKIGINIRFYLDRRLAGEKLFVRFNDEVYNLPDMATKEYIDIHPGSCEIVVFNESETLVTWYHHEFKPEETAHFYIRKTPDGKLSIFIDDQILIFMDKEALNEWRKAAK